MELFDFSETCPSHKIYTKFPNLEVNKNPSFYLILRGLIGDLEIKQNFTGKTFTQNQNYLDGNLKHLSIIDSEQKRELKEVDPTLKIEIQNLFDVLKQKCKSNIEILPDYISDTFDLNELSLILKNRAIINRNKDFFETLNSEFCNFYYQTSKTNHTIAFLHLYRILEYASYSFPLMYASSSNDFSKSYDQFKTLFREDKDQSELKVFKYFINDIISVEKSYKNLTIDIHIVSNHSFYNEKIYKMLLKICEASFFEQHKNIQNSKVCVKFSEFSSFMITIRNRFFHLKNSQGNNNIHSSDIIDSDYFFQLINTKCAYFLSLITFEIIKKSYFSN